ncbi:nuclear pore complex protein [Seminavis robusta]|uniref:Nuclear pore complex protein n=1 Tax=Seminavis robusta TaxID=568900 RepID=A0A9N8E4V6_9STRA|nr:nuclear pore complex protein [Seminavis robusta]|eukprot:Sro552_g165090.1 nuclear pore complex protein (185) ;mRNA; f:32340-32894
MVVSLQKEPSTKRRRCLIGEERKLPDTDDDHAKESDSPKVAVAAHAAPQAAAAAAAASKPVTTIFVGGLHPRIVEAHLEKMCSPYGTIQRLHLCDRKGYAFCQYSSPHEAEAAMQALDGRGLLGRRLMVRPAHNDTHQSNANTGLGGAASNPNNSSSSNPDKERERIEARIQAVKRKLDARQSS